MNKSKIFFILILSFIGGIFSASFYYPKIINDFYIFANLILTLIFLFVFYKNKKIYLVTFAILFFLAGVWMTTSRLEKIINLNQERKNFSGEVIVIKEPETKDRMQKIVVVERGLSPHKGDLVPKQGKKFLITTNAYAVYNYGDKLKVNCNLEIPENINAFDYRMYLAKDNIFYLCKNPKIEFLANNQGNKTYTAILKIKNKLQEKIIMLLPAPQSGLLIGLILGGDNQLSKEMQDDFSATGLTHIVAVSGYNVTIVAEYLMLLGIFFGLWRKQAFWFAIAGIFLFVVMTGFPASAVRAGVMGSLILWAMKNGRLASAQNSIIFSAGVMLLWNPLLLLWDIGFQLSFLATLGIIYFYPSIEKYAIKKQGISFFNEILFLTLSAQIFVLPIILIDFQKLSIISPLANLAVLPIIPLIMLLGFLMVLASFIFPPLDIILSWLTFLPLKYETTVIEWMADLQFSSVEILNFSWMWVTGWYIILIGFLFFSKRTRQRHNDQNFLMENVLEKDDKVPF
jgi:competence protein ComEC